MRISDWSSDVCSSDLLERKGERCRHIQMRLPGDVTNQCRRRNQGSALHGEQLDQRHDAPLRDHRKRQRSEEHTSELQSLMRISYAVFCLKKKKKHKKARMTEQKNKTNTDDNNK